MADICGRGAAGVYCALSNGSSFGAFTVWTTGFSDNHAWDASESRWGTLQFPDVNGDKMADVCGRSIAGVWCEVSTGSSFTPTYVPWIQEYSDAKNWNSNPAYWKTIQFPDLNNDGKADVCGRGEYGLLCALSTAGLSICVNVVTISPACAAGNVEARL
jgi:hypothetical protein